MIRYVLAILLATAVVGVTALALEHGSTVRSEVQIERQIAAVERAAVSLTANDDPVPGSHAPPRRTVDVELPGDGFAEMRVETLVFEPVPGADKSFVRYAFEGQSERRMVVSAPLVGSDPHTGGDLGGRTGSQTLILELVSDEHHGRAVRVTLA